VKPNLLEITQEILSDMDSDVINSIDDTDEATQVAQIVKSTFEAMISNRNWPHTARLINLVASTDNTLPTHMTIAEDVKEFISVFYDKRKSTETRLRYDEVKYKGPDDFLRYTNNRDSTNSNILTITDPSGILLLIQDDKAPSFYTSFDDNTLVFDSYDSAVDTTLQSSKTQARAFVIPTFELSDTHIPDLPTEAFSALIEEAKSKAQFKLKQMQDIKSEQEASRQQRWLSRKAWRVHGGIRYPDYGRKRRAPYNYRDVTFKDE
jgi:6-pyruvoyl-tetrahydropterin synthase